MAGLLDSPLLPALFAGLAAFLLFVGGALLIGGTVSRNARLKAVAGLSRKGRLVLRETDSEKAERWRQDAIRVIRASTTRMNPIRDTQVKTIRQRLTRAGYRGRDAVLVYAFAKVVVPLLITGGVVFFIFFVQPLDYSIVMQIGLVLAAALAGSILPDLWLKNTEQRRLTQVRRSLPDALDLMVICAEAGLSLDASLKRVSTEMARTSPILADEVAYTCLELRFLTDRRRAVESLPERIDLPAVRALSSTLIQTEKYGTPLAQALRVLGAEQRTERMLRAEEKAARLPAIMTVPLIVFILPALFVVLLGPGALTMMDTLLAKW